MFYVYCILNIQNNKRYIGKTDNIKLREANHRSIAFNKNSPNHKYPFYKAVRKYAKTNDNFLNDNSFTYEWILQYQTEKEAFDYETYFINLYQTNVSVYKNKALGYNLTPGGEGAKGIRWSKKARRLFSEKCKGRKISDSTKEKLRIASTGYRHTDEAKLRISLSKIGSKNPNFGKSVSNHTRALLSKSLKGKIRGPLTKEHKEKLSKSKINKPGKSHTQNTKDLLSFARRGNKSTSAKLTWDIVNEIRAIHKNKEMGYVKLSKKYNVAIGTIAHIIKNRTWKV